MALLATGLVIAGGFLLGGLFGVGNTNEINQINEQVAQTMITQQFSGTCQMNCINQMNDVSVNVRNSDVGDVSIGQYCTVDGNCLLNGSMNASADTMFSAQNSVPNQSSAGGLFSGIGNSTITNQANLQEIQTNIVQSTSEQCGFNSVNQMSDVSINVLNSTTGNLSIEQTGGVNANCALNSNMNAAATTTGLATNTACQGKKMQCKLISKKAAKGSSNFWLWIIILIAIVIGIAIVVKIFQSGKGKCPYGMKQVKGKDGKMVCPDLPIQRLELVGVKKGKPAVKKIITEVDIPLTTTKAQFDDFVGNNPQLNDFFRQDNLDVSLN